MTTRFEVFVFFVTWWLTSLFNNTELGRPCPGVAGEFVVGRREGLFREDRNVPGLLRRPKRLLNSAIFARVEADHSESSAALQMLGRLTQQRVEVGQLFVHGHSQGHEGARGGVDFLCTR